jgi:thioredoxin-related protein
MQRKPLAARARVLATRLVALAASVAAGSAAAAPPPPDRAPRWSTDVEAAFAEARAADKLVFVDLYADWCGWCKVLEREVFPQPEFQAHARRAVLLRVDVEDGGAGTELAARFDAWSLPTLLVLEPSGALAGTVSGYAPTRQYVAKLEAALAAHQRTLELYRATLASGDLEALSRVAVQCVERHDGGRAAALLEKLLTSATLRPEQEIWTRVLLADAWRMAGELTKARAAAAAAEAAARRASELEPGLGERVDLLAFWIAEAGKECGAAAGALSRFEQRHPDSRLLDGARRAMQRLRSDAGPRCT